MIRRRRPLLRAAVIGGGAYAVGRHNANRNAEEAQAEAEQNARLNDLEQQGAAPQAPPQQAYAPPPPEPAAAPAGPSLLDQLNQLDALHQSGALTDNEFTAAKAKLLGG
jgi:Short C-terminal domain